VNLHNTIIIPPGDRENARAVLKDLINDPKRDKIYFMVIGPEDQTAAIVQLSDELAEPGVCELGRFCVKVVWINDPEILREELEGLLTKCKSYTADYAQVRCFTFSQFHDTTTDIICATEAVDWKRVRRAFLYREF
jgi:hypothetical protein